MDTNTTGKKNDLTREIVFVPPSKILYVLWRIADNTATNTFPKDAKTIFDDCRHTTEPLIFFNNELCRFTINGFDFGFFNIGIDGFPPSTKQIL
jgi:hypothetical protein